MALDHLRGLLGIPILIGIAYLFSSNRKNINWRIVLSGVILQFVLAVLLIKVDFVRKIFNLIVQFFVIMIDSMQEAAEFLFGNLAKPVEPFGFAFVALPTIIFFAAISSLLYYYGVLQKIVWGFAYVMRKTMRLTGAESLAAAANVFIGQTEAPIVVKPYIEKMTRSEIMCLMTGGMATIAGSVFGAYMTMLGGGSKEEIAFFGMHLLTASIISAPAAIMISKILVPEEKGVIADANSAMDIPRQESGSNALDAISSGTIEGTKLAVNVGAMLLAFMAFVYFINKILGGIGEWTNINHHMVRWSDGAFESLSLQSILGYIFAPIAWILGVSSEDLLQVGRLLGEKTALNEFVGYLSLADLKNQGALSERSIIISTYALCGFANFASIGIQIGGIGSLAPGRRKTLTELGFLALIGGTIACFITAAIAGVLV